MPVGVLQFFFELADRLLVKRRLLLGQAAIGLHFGLVRQIGDHALVGLQPAQNVRLHQRAQRLIRRLGQRFHFLTKFANALAPPSRPGFRKSNSDHRSESRFSTGVPVMAMRPAGLQLLGGARLAGAGILDGLGFVENDQVPGSLAQPLQARQHAVGGDDQVAIVRRRRRRIPPCRPAFPTGERSRYVSDGANRSISAFQLAISEAGTTSRLGGLPGARLWAGRSRLRAEQAGRSPGRSCPGPCRRPGRRRGRAGSGNAANPGRVR